MFEALRNRLRPTPPAADPQRSPAAARLEALQDTKAAPAASGASIADKLQQSRERERALEASAQRCLLLFSNHLGTIAGIHEYLPLLDRVLADQKATAEVARRVCGKIENALNDFYKANASGQTRTGRTDVVIPESRTGFALIAKPMAEARFVDSIGKLATHMNQWCVEWVARQPKAQQ